MATRNSSACPAYPVRCGPCCKNIWRLAPQVSPGKLLANEDYPYLRDIRACSGRCREKLQGTGQGNDVGSRRRCVRKHSCNRAYREDAVKILDAVEQNARQKLGHAVFGTGDETLESAVALLLKKHNKTIAVAESCTGGLVSDKLTNIPGISEFFLEGVVAYSNRAKSSILGVPEELITKHGAVSREVARAMAEGIQKRSAANVGIGTTGIAGPGGATKDKPVGLVYVAVVSDGVFEVKELRLRGARIDIKGFPHIAR